MFVDFTEVVHGLLEPFEMYGQDSGRTEYQELFGSVTVIERLILAMSTKMHLSTNLH